MNLTKVIRRTVAPEARSLSFQDIWDKAFDINNLGNTKAGVRVSRDSVTQLSTVYGSWRIISEGVATLPRDAMIRRDGIPRPYRPRPGWLDRPDAYLTWPEWMGQIMVSLLSHGNAYILVQWNLDGTVSRLVVLDPYAVTINKVKGLLSYTVGSADISASFPPVNPMGMIERNEILHLRGMTIPGCLYGINPIEAVAETFGISLAAQRYGASFFANDGTPGGIIEIPPEVKLSPRGQQALREAWRDLFGGPTRAKEIAVLTDGAKFQALQVSPDEAQFLETRKFQVSDIARIYGVPPHLLADASNSTSWGSGLAEQNTAYVIHSLRPWLERLEARLTMLVQAEAYNRGEVTLLDGPQVYININEEALLRGASKERWETHRANVLSGLLTADEARQEEGYAPLPEGLGAVPWIPLAQAPGGTTDTEEEAPPPSPEAMEGDTA